MKNTSPSVPTGAPRTKVLWILTGLLLLAGQVLFFIWHTNWAVQSFTRAAVPPDKIEDL